MNRSIPNEEILEYCKMRLEGYTFQQIAEKFGTSKQNIQGILFRRFGETPKGKKVFSKIVFPKVSEFMKDNKMTIKSISHHMGLKSSTVTGYLYGKTSPSKSFIDSMVKLTDIPYEDLFSKEEK